MNQGHQAQGAAVTHPVQFKGSRTARLILRALGWSYRFNGLPSLQGVIVVYPHTSNWDFVIGILLKWAMGIQAHFWGKDTLFKVPVLGPWIRWLGGIPIHRQSSNGVVGQTIDHLNQCRDQQQLFWLALAPEGTRSKTPGWRTGFYQVAWGAQVPLGVARFDWTHKCLDLSHFLTLTGDMDADFKRMAELLDGATGARPEQAGPVQAWVKASPDQAMNQPLDQRSGTGPGTSTHSSSNA